MPSRLRHRVATPPSPITPAAARLTVAAAIVTIAGCAPVEEAPADLDALLRRTWVDFHTASDDDLATLATQAFDLLDPSARAEADLTGRQSRLDAADQALVDLAAPPSDDGTWTLPDIEAAAPIFLVKRFPCGLDALARILSEPDQLALYPEYETYTRTYTEGTVASFRDGDIDALGWEVALSANYAGLIKYAQDLRGRMRRVPLPEGGPWTGSHFLMTRTYIPWPAQFEQDANAFVQDYQIETFLPLDGDIVHLYGVWRETRLIGQTLEGDGLANIMLNGLADWDDTTAEHCAAGRP